MSQLFQCYVFQVALLMTFGSNPRVRIENAFPACCIAFWNGDKEPALELWKQCRWQTNRQKIDVLGRTFTHVVAEADDPEMLRAIAQVDIGAVRGNVPDARGLTALAITICKGHERCFDLLSQYSPRWISRSPFEPRLLDL